MSNRSLHCAKPYFNVQCQPTASQCLRSIDNKNPRDLSLFIADLIMKFILKLQKCLTISTSVTKIENLSFSHFTSPMAASELHCYLVGTILQEHKPEIWWKIKNKI